MPFTHIHQRTGMLGCCWCTDNTHAPAGASGDTQAKDGVCDEGRGGNLTAASPGANWVYCDLGTDCSDCGAWQGVAHGPTW